MAQAFETQRALLEYLNKNVNDRSLVQRMIKRGEVYKEGEMYYLVEGVERAEEKKSESKAKVEIDDKELKELKEKNEKLMAAYKKLVKEKEAYMGMYDHLVFFYEKFQRYHKFVEGKVFGQTQGRMRDNGTQETMEMNRPSVYERYDFSYGENEKAECEAVDRIISQRDEELSNIPF